LEKLGSGDRVGRECLGECRSSWLSASLAAAAAVVVAPLGLFCLEHADCWSALRRVASRAAGTVRVVTAAIGEAAGQEEARSRYMLVFRGGAVSRDDVSPSVLQAHLEKWYAWADELARQGRRNVGTPLADGGKAVRGHERFVTDGPYAESKDLVTGAMIIEAASLDDAVEVARGCPTYEFGGSVEVRPVQDESC
jgi:hypothetical protein